MGKLEEIAELAARLGGQAPAFSLPDIPSGYVRLTHVMPERSRQILASGEPFKYGRYGLGGTTDAYSNNDAIAHLAKTGNPMGPGSAGNWSRSDFGDHMALIDLPADIHKKIFRTLGYDRPIPNEAIVGFVDRPSMSFTANARYSQEVIDKYAADAAEEIRRLIQEQNARRFGGRAAVQPPDFTPTRSPASGDDIW